MSLRTRLSLGVVALALGACGEMATLPISAGTGPQPTPGNVLTGFPGEEGNAYGRPVGVVLDRQGALLVDDDVGNVVWRVTPASSKQ